MADTPAILKSYRDRKLIVSLSDLIRRRSKKDIRIMEVCGGHTNAIHRFGLLDLLPPTIKLISGPGCPVCVTPASYIDGAIAACLERKATIITFGDLIRVPGTDMSLEEARARGGDIRIVYSPIDALEIASGNNKETIFLAIGFETTAPAIAITIKEAARRALKNFFIASSLKLMPPAMIALAEMDDCRINGFICPGHVSAIIGWASYQPLAERFGLACAVSGFEPVDIMESILNIVLQIEKERPAVYNQYDRAVSCNGNTRALEAIYEVFSSTPAHWRGLGEIERSGLCLKASYSDFDALRKILINRSEQEKEMTECICSDILTGKAEPPQCNLFGLTCRPDSPAGACMVSREGACYIWHKYCVS